MADNKDITTFEDAENSNINFNQDKQTFRSIILSHLNNILRFASVEFRGGYWEDRPVMMGNINGTVKVYVEDSREVYSNAIEAFADALFPYFDKKMRDAEEVCIKELEQTYNFYTVEVELKIAEETYIDRNFKDLDNRTSYRHERVKINRKLFRALCDFLHRKKYLEVGTLED